MGHKFIEKQFHSSCGNYFSLFIIMLSKVKKLISVSSQHYMRRENMVRPNAKLMQHISESSLGVFFRLPFHGAVPLCCKNFSIINTELMS